LFPQFQIVLISGAAKKLASTPTTPTVFVGTHAVISRLEKIKPALIIYDEQHRFGVSQRSFSPTDQEQQQPNILTMSATPIPRSLMLTLFSHLSVSQLRELPPGRLPVTSWVVSEQKRHASWDWVAQQIAETKMQAFMVCPFIEQSETAAFEAVASVTSLYEQLTTYLQDHFPSLRTAVLHGKMSARAKSQLTAQLYAGEIDILVTTPVIEVGLDVPNAGIIVIESSERFGLASLHQLRGRVGRAGQQAYCLLFTSQPGKHTRLHDFAHETNGLKLAELDLQRRGAGDLFGTEQSGFDTLRFANWTNLALIAQARQAYDLLEARATTWQPLLPLRSEQAGHLAAN
jgi:ATP-dependent DNA helicase RecG